MARSRSSAAVKEKPAVAKVEEAPAPKAEKTREVPDALNVMDDKRAQYARLVIFNYAKDTGAKKFGIKADDTVATVSDDVILKAGKELVGGNMLDGGDGLAFIQTYSANGSTTGRALTTSYASEVRPFIRKLKVSAGFGRRGGLTDEEKAARDAERLQKRIESTLERGGVALKDVKGTGDAGAVTLEDAQNAVKAKRAAEKKEADEKKAAEAKKKEEADAKKAAADAKK